VTYDLSKLNEKEFHGYGLRQSECEEGRKCEERVVDIAIDIAKRGPTATSQARETETDVG
jgi:hypothetical protein